MLSMMPRLALQDILVGIHPETCRNRQVVLRQEKHVHTEHHDSSRRNFRYETSEQIVVVYTTAFEMDPDRKECH